RAAGRGVVWLRDHPRALWLALGLVVACAAAAYLGAPHWRVSRHLRAARQALARRDFEDAQEDLDRCLADRPDAGGVPFLAGRCARRRDAFDQAERHLEACDRLRWSRARVALERDLMRAQQGDLGAVAGPLHARAKEGHPDRLLILEALAAGSLRAYQLAQAQTYLRDWLQRDPDDFQALLWYGEGLERRHAWPGA